MLNSQLSGGLLKSAFIECAAATSALLECALAQEREHALILLDSNAHVVTWYPGARNVLGYEPAEMAGETLHRIFSADDLARGELDLEFRAATSYGKYEADRWHVRKDGIRIWTTGVTTAVRNDHDVLIGFMKVLRDRTDLRGQLDALQSRVESAARSESEQHVVLGTLAHELRNPLGPLRNAAAVIRALAADQPKIASSLEIIDRQVRFIESVIEDLLESTRAGVGKTALHYETVQLADVVAKALETCSIGLTERMQSAEVLLPEGLTIEADPVRLQQVLVNLVQNASKFSPVGNSIWIKASVDTDEVVIHIEDHGQGIPSELLPKIFDLFTQARPEGAGREHALGLGLGLGLVKSLVELHGGTVQARSEGVGKGTEIIVRLPVERPHCSSHS